MGPNILSGKAVVLLFCFVLLTTQEEELFAQATNRKASASSILIIGIERTVEVSRAGSQRWDLAYTNQVLYAGDRVRTREGARLTLRWSDLSTIRINEMTDLQIDPPPEKKAQHGFSLLKGVVFFFHRDKPADVRVKTRTASAAVRGTEFNIETDNNDRTVLTLIDGEVALSNTTGEVLLRSGEQGIVAPGKMPAKVTGIQIINVIQWCLYYPAVLDTTELNLSAAETQALNASLTAYAEGDLLRALDSYPATRQSTSPSEKIYLAALLLAVGQVDRSASLLDSDGGAATTSNTVGALSAALRQVVSAVKLQRYERSAISERATEWLAESYYQQSRTGNGGEHQANLEAALRAAREAVAKSPHFAFGWERVAELQFSFGHTSEALEALNKSLALAPRNPEAIALKGFLLAAQNRVAQAITYFDQAIAIDPALGNAWLGRGLCRIRQGYGQLGREDLQIAATVEPQRAVLRSYLGKAYTDVGDVDRAAKEIRLAKELDARDPTAWLYSALLNQQDNRINEAVRDLERSQELNDNRSIYRSRLLLDQDRAMRSANLANIYRDVGMFDVSVREAGRAVSYDYANYSAHLFLADSFNQLRDPKQINLRFETPAESEYLLANLLAPVGAGVLSPTISQQEYSKLLERDGLSLHSSTEYFSGGDWIQSGAQFGTFGTFGYAAEAFYRSENGQRPNNDLEQRTLSLRVKQQLTAKDSAYLQALLYDASGGDLFQYYDQSSANPGFRTRERQEPILTLGYHREWNPGNHTLLLAGRFDDTYHVHDPQELIVIKGVFQGQVGGIRPINIVQDYRSQLEIYSTELQHIWQQHGHDTILGARLQWGDFEVRNVQAHPSELAGLFNEPIVQEVAPHLDRQSVYAYHHWQLLSPLLLIGGVSYDHMSFPENFRLAPLSDEEETVDQISPKGGLIWTIGKNTTARAAYAQSLAGASLDQSIRLEPTQVAGFNQAFRSIIPESVSGANAGARFETYGVSLEQKFPTGTYLGASGQILNSTVRRTFGVFVLDLDVSDFVFPGGEREHLDFRERSLLFTFDQLLGTEWSLGSRYRLSDAKLADVFVNVPDTALLFPPFERRRDVQAVLHQLDTHLIFNHPSGFFAQFQSLWYLQSNSGYDPDRPGQDLWQFNLFAGYRFPGRRAEVRLGLLNLTDRDYRLNPLTLYNELPRERTLVARLQFNF
jgi:tetratricopeptide (TPR) repeat protein